MKQWVLLGFLLMSLFACAGGPPFGKRLTPEEALERRVTAYWEAKQKKDWAAVRSFVDPEIREISANPEQQEDDLNTSEIVGWEVSEINMSGDTAVVIMKVSIMLTHPLLGGKPFPSEQIFRDQWVRRKGEWFIVIVRPSLDKVLQDLQNRHRSDQ